MNQIETCEHEVDISDIDWDHNRDKAVVKNWLQLRTTMATENKLEGIRLCDKVLDNLCSSYFSETEIYILDSFASGSLTNPPHWFCRYGYVSISGELTDLGKSLISWRQARGVE